jgi:hypothetical protein
MKQQKKKYSSPKIYEYRIKYNAGPDHAVNDSYHYFQAETAEQALDFHESMMAKKKLKCQTISVERRDQYRFLAGIPPKWVLECTSLNNE